MWTETGPISHEGRFYRFEDASTAVRCVQSPRLPIYFGGASDAAVAVAGRHADVFALWGETHAQVREIVSRVRAEAAKNARRVRFSLSFRPILADTEEAAWQRADTIKQTILRLRGQVAVTPANEGSRRCQAAGPAARPVPPRLLHCPKSRQAAGARQLPRP